MRNITSQKKNNLNSYTNNDGNDNEEEDEEEEEEEEIVRVDVKGEKKVEIGVQKELEHEEDRCLEGKKVLSLVEPGNIRRVIFCSGKVRTCILTPTQQYVQEYIHTYIHKHTHIKVIPKITTILHLSIFLFLGFLPSLSC